MGRESAIVPTSHHIAIFTAAPHIAARGITLRAGGAAAELADPIVGDLGGWRDTSSFGSDVKSRSAGLRF